MKNEVGTTQYCCHNLYIVLFSISFDINIIWSYGPLVHSKRYFSLYLILMGKTIISAYPQPTIFMSLHLVSLVQMRKKDHKHQLFALYLINSSPWIFIPCIHAIAYNTNNSYYVLFKDDNSFGLSDAGIGATVISNYERRKEVIWESS